MVNAAYTVGGMGTSFVEVPSYYNGYEITNQVKLPSCGVIYEVDTNGLDIRKPEIRPELQGVYNNGFEGDEWIADTIPSKFHKVKRLILSRFANDSEKFVVDVENAGDEALQKAIDIVKEKYNEKKTAALKFKEKLEGLTEDQRRNQFRINQILQEK